MPDLSILIGEIPDTDELISSGMLEVRLGMEVSVPGSSIINGRKAALCQVLLFCAPPVPSVI